MKTSQRGIDLIKNFESLQLRVYVDPVGIPTIGYGHTNGVTMATRPIVVSQADRFLAEDIEEFEAGVTAAVKVPLNQNQFDALVSFAFNLGIGSLQRSTLLKHLNARKVAQAAAEFPRWNMAGGKALPGLTRRRAAEARLFNKPITQEKTMSKFTSTDPTQNALLADAQKLVRQRALVGLPSYGIFANAVGSQELLPESDFRQRGQVIGDEPACLLIKFADRQRPDDSAAVDADDDYINVGRTLKELGEASSLEQGVIDMIAYESNLIGRVFQPGEAERRIANVPAVAKASAAAFESAWIGA